MLGRTPEVLLDIKKNSKQACTVALAGTLARSENAVSDIMSDAKIRAEHEYVIDDIKNKLSEKRLSIGSTEALVLKHLVHLKTDFSFDIEGGSDALEVIDLLHPTAAMGVYPTSREQLLNFYGVDLQKRRGLFAAPFGVISKDEALVVVAIRNLIFENGGLSIFSGCGITQDSDYQSELAELQNKRNSVKKMLGLLNE